jgi:hypothetical protein
VTSDERRARNEALFRRVNERMKEIDDRLNTVAVSAPAAEHEEFVCECGRIECTVPLTMSRDEYEQARSDPTHFLVFPEHVDPEIEQVVTETERYCLVKKDPPESEVARATDPRSG